MDLDLDLLMSGVGGGAVYVVVLCHFEVLLRLEGGRDEDVDLEIVYIGC